MQGFEPRGTDIGIRLSAWTELQQNTGPGKLLSVMPRKLADKTAGRYCTKMAMCMTRPCVTWQARAEANCRALRLAYVITHQKQA